MTAVVSLLTVSALIVLPWCALVVVRRILRAVGPLPSDDTSALPPYGRLPLIEPVGALGQLSPDADISDPASNSRNLYGT